MSTEYDADIEEWIKDFEKLPKENQENLKKWFGTQKLIIDNSGLTPLEWFEFVSWALDNPYDYSFINDFPDVPDVSGSKDGAERADQTRGARALVGSDTKRSAPDGKGIQEKAGAKKGLERELFDNFMKNRLGHK